MKYSSMKVVLKITQYLTIAGTSTFLLAIAVQLLIQIFGYQCNIHVYIQYDYLNIEAYEILMSPSNIDEPINVINALTCFALIETKAALLLIIFIYQQSSHHCTYQ